MPINELPQQPTIKELKQRYKHAKRLYKQYEKRVRAGRVTMENLCAMGDFSIDMKWCKDKIKELSESKFLVFNCEIVVEKPN